MAKGSQGSSHHLKVVGGAYGKRKDLIYEFVCKDTGLGMSEEFQKHAFEPFTCEGKPTTTGYNGTGLGLSIVKDIVEMMHGTIQMESKENVGTTFRILLPLQIDPNPQIIKPIQTKPLNLNI